VFASANPTAGVSAWREIEVAPGPKSFNGYPTEIPLGSPSAISCPAATMCVMTDTSGSIATSTNPIGP
jgi:hypothetical protein